EGRQGSWGPGAGGWGRKSEVSQSPASWGQDLRVSPPPWVHPIARVMGPGSEGFATPMGPPDRQGHGATPRGCLVPLISRGGVPRSVPDRFAEIWAAMVSRDEDASSGRDVASSCV